MSFRYISMCLVCSKSFENLGETVTVFFFFNLVNVNILLNTNVAAFRPTATKGRHFTVIWIYQASSDRQMYLRSTFTRVKNNIRSYIYFLDVTDFYYVYI